MCTVYGTFRILQKHGATDQTLMYFSNSALVQNESDFELHAFLCCLEQRQTVLIFNKYKQPFEMGARNPLQFVHVLIKY
jgi:hypothetical protein